METERVKLAVTVHPSRPPKWQRCGWSAASLLTFVVGCLMLNAFPIAPVLTFGGIVMWLVTPLVLRRSPYRAEIETSPGSLRVRPRFGLPYRIETSTLEGASIAMKDDVHVLTVSERPRALTTFELERGAGTDDLRRVLGIPTGGFGELWWRHRPRPIEYIVFFFRALATVAIVGSRLLGRDEHVLGTIGLMLVLFTFFAMLFDAAASPWIVALRREGVAWNSGDRPVNVEYSEITRIEDDGRAFTVHASGERTFVVHCAPTHVIAAGLRAGERSAMIAQLRDAVVRSKGRARVDESAAYVNELDRGASSAAEWLARIDALAVSHVNAPAGYRGATIPREALWRILEDHDAQATIRAAAARVLWKTIGEPAASRIEDAIVSTHDESARGLLRAVLDDEAREVLEEIEREARLAGELTK